MEPIVAVPCRPTPERIPVLPGLEVRRAAWTEEAREILPPEALELVARLERDLGTERRRLLADRRGRQARWDGGGLPHGPSPGAAAEAGWRVAPIPADCRRRRVEITGPVDDPKMVINMLSRTEEGHRADAAMLDFEDSMKPDWPNVVRGMRNLKGAVDGTLSYRRPATPDRPEKLYRLDPADMPLLMVRCRGLHLEETNVQVEGRPVSAGLFDLALAVFHTASGLVAQGRTPKYYIPKCEHPREARWWNLLLGRLEEESGLPRGTCRVTLLIETLPAALRMEEILYEVRERACGLNVGRWDKIFSDIKVLKLHPDRVLADRGTIDLERPWMRAYAERLVSICHRRGAFAMGGMAAFTPGRDPETRERQVRKVVEDKRLEASLGHDGCWVSHPFFLGPALEAFPRENQLDVLPEPPPVEELLPRGGGPRTLAGLRKNVRVGIAYLEGWNRGIGCVAWDDLMEDLATLEISRAQTWQWIRHRIRLDDGTTVTRELVERIFAEELETIHDELTRDGGEARDLAARMRWFTRAARDAERLFLESEFRDFLTLASQPASAEAGGREG